MGIVRDYLNKATKAAISLPGDILGAMPNVLLHGKKAFWEASGAVMAAVSPPLANLCNRFSAGASEDIEKRRQSNKVKETRVEKAEHETETVLTEQNAESKISQTKSDAEQREIKMQTGERVLEIKATADLKRTEGQIEHNHTQLKTLGKTEIAQEKMGSLQQDNKESQTRVYGKQTEFNKGEKNFSDTALKQEKQENVTLLGTHKSNMNIAEKITETNKGMEFNGDIQPANWMEKIKDQSEARNDNISSSQNTV